ncbi:hypothetical protein Trydic_g1526 [Trypoxylus dichotomus]
MFSFFKKSKKEGDASSGRESKEKKSKERELKADHSTSIPASRVTKDMCKNKSSQKCENAPAGGTYNGPENRSKDTAFPLTSDNLVIDNERKTNDIIHRKPEQSDRKSQLSPQLEDITASISEPMLSFFAKRSPDSGQSQNVKPCGHGTVAISPRIPPQAIETPPESPKLDFRRRKSKDVIEEINSDNSTEVPRNAIKERLQELDTKRNGDNSLQEQFFDANFDEDDVKNLINQEAKFQKQLNELNQQLAQRDADASKLRFQMEELQRDVFTKSAGIDRLQSELQAAHKESELLRQKLKYFEDEMSRVKDRNSELVDEINTKSENYISLGKETKAKIEELENIIKELKNKIEQLEQQIEELRAEKEKLEKEHEGILNEKEEQKKLIEKALDEALKQKTDVDKKWEEEFEKLRTLNMIKEQQTLDDFEWKLREVEKSCKMKLQEKDKDLEERLQEACKDAELKLMLAEEMMEEVKHLKSYEVEVKQLRGLTQEQGNSIKHMTEQQAQMLLAEQSLKDEAKRLRKLVETEKENLQHIQRLHNQEITNKERVLHNQLEEKKTEIAIYWEERLLHECGRLKSELEQLHNEEKQYAMEIVRRQKDDEFKEHKKKWEEKLQESLKEISNLKQTIRTKDEEHHSEIVAQQGKTDRDIMELRRLMDKIDMTHHDNFEKLVISHEEEIDRINEEHEKKIKEVENTCQNQVSSLRATLELVKEQMARDSQQKIQTLIHQHRAELDTQWANLIHQKSEAIKLVEDEYVLKYKTLEEQFYTQQKSHEAREIELLKSIDSLKNEITSKESAVDDLQNNVDTLEGGIQVLNCTIRGLQEEMANTQARHQKECGQYENQLHQVQKQSQTTIDHLQRKCQCLTKLFEEVRARYERRESRQEDLNLISDLRQVIAEQEKDLACINEEKRYYQMKLMSLQRSMEEEDEDFVDTEDFEQNSQSQISSLSIPPTIPECDDYDD